jgi:tetratricopeptide (TPR) repeat protein
MSTSSERPPDAFESTLEAAHSLMRRKEGDEACRLLADAAERAISSDALAHASLFSSVRGSYLVALGRNDEALAAYLEAERHSESDIYDQLITARHLVVGMNQPKRALEKVNPLMDSIQDPAAHQAARAIRGIALVSLDQPDAAIDEMEAICEEFPVGLPAVSLDLTLVEVLAHAGVATDVCRRYLSLVESKAKQDDDSHVLARVAELQDLLPRPG